MSDRQFRMIMMVLFGIAEALIFGPLEVKGRAMIMLAMEDFERWKGESDQ